MDSRPPTTDALLAALPTPMPPTDASTRSKVRLAWVSMAMCIRPLAYLALIAALGIAWYDWLLNGVDHLDWDPNQRLLPEGFLYLIGLVVGPLIITMLVVYAIKREEDPSETLSLQRAEEPKLFALIDRISELQGTPVPDHIHVQLGMGAGAFYGSGIRSPFARDIVLTIGLPLAACMDLRQLTGCLSHALGNFSQCPNVRAHHWICWADKWFSGAVSRLGNARKEHWDDGIAEPLQQGLFSIPISLLAGACFWTLKGFMAASQSLVDWLYNQTESDPDALAVRMVGATCFEEIMRKLVLAERAQEEAHTYLESAVKIGRLPDNYPYFAAKSLMAIPEETAGQIWSEGFGGPEGAHGKWATGDARIQRAFTIENPGNFPIDAPGTDLFQHWERYCLQLTKEWYISGHGSSFNPSLLVPAQGEFTRAVQLETLLRSCSQFFGADVDRLFALEVPLPSSQGQAPDRSEYLEACGAFRHSIELVLERKRTLSEQFEEWVRLSYALQIHDAGVPGVLESMDLGSADPEFLRERSAQLRKTQEIGLDPTGELSAGIKDRLQCALALAETLLLDRPELATQLRLALHEQSIMVNLVGAIEAALKHIEVAGRLYRTVEPMQPKQGHEYQKALDAEFIPLRASMVRVQSEARVLPAIAFGPLEFLFPNGLPQSEVPYDWIVEGLMLRGRYSQWCKAHLGAVAIATQAIEEALDWGLPDSPADDTYPCSLVVR